MSILIDIDFNCNLSNVEFFSKFESDVMPVELKIKIDNTNIDPL